ncbi:MAG: hypothetical protein AAFV53_38370 [Myxococcota bacterium]
MNIYNVCGHEYVAAKDWADLKRLLTQSEQSCDVDHIIEDTHEVSADVMIAVDFESGFPEDEWPGGDLMGGWDSDGSVTIETTADQWAEWAGQRGDDYTSRYIGAID